MPPPKGFQSGISAAERRFSLFVRRLGVELREHDLNEDFLIKMLTEARTATFGKASGDDDTGEEVLSSVTVDEPEKCQLGTNSLGIEPELIKTRGLPSVTADALDDLVRSFYNQQLSQNSRVNLGWRIAAGYSELRSGKRLSQTFTPGPPEWVSLRIEEASYGRVFNTARGPSQTLELTMRVMKGRFAGLTFKQLIPYKYVMFKLARDIGFPKFVKIDKNDLVLAGFVGMLDPAGKYGPTLIEFFAGTSLQSRNRALWKLRLEPCPLGFSWPCTKCTLGHESGSINDYDKLQMLDLGSCPSCLRATHINSYIKRPCSQCNGDKWFDPYDTGSICISCRNKEAFSRLKAVKH